MALFLERAQAVRTDVLRLHPAVHELIRRLDGLLPLAIELAAARVKLLGPEQLLERIGERLDLLKGARDADPRHVRLRATIDWWYGLLDPTSSGSSPVLACSAAAAPSTRPNRSATPTSTRLPRCSTRASSVAGVPTWTGERYWMLETIREFARDRLDASGEEVPLRRVQADRLIGLADRAGLRAVAESPRAWDFDLVAPKMEQRARRAGWGARARSRARSPAREVYVRGVLGDS